MNNCGHLESIKCVSIAVPSGAPNSTSLKTEMCDQQPVYPGIGDECCRCTAKLETKDDVRHAKKKWRQTKMDTWFCSGICKSKSEQFEQRIQAIRDFAIASGADLLGECDVCHMECYNGACLQYEPTEGGKLLLCSPLCMDRYSKDFPEQGTAVMGHFTPEATRARMAEDGSLDKLTKQLEVTLDGLTEEQKVKVLQDAEHMLG